MERSTIKLMKRKGSTDAEITKAPGRDRKLCCSPERREFQTDGWKGTPFRPFQSSLYSDHLVSTEIHSSESKIRIIFGSGAHATQMIQHLREQIIEGFEPFNILNDIALVEVQLVNTRGKG